MNLIDLLGGIDNGAQGDILGDRRPLELVKTLSKQRGIQIEVGKIIHDLAGGPDGILRSPNKRNALFMALSNDQRAEITSALGSNVDIYSFHNSSTKIAKLKAVFEVEQEDPITSYQHHDPFKIGVVNPQYGLFEHQSTALAECTTYLESDSPRVMLHMPTGSGKTRTAMHLIARHLNRRTKSLVVWMVSGKELCEQAASEFELSWSNLGERPIPIIKLWSDKSGVKETYEEQMKSRSESCSASEFLESPWPKNLKDGVIIGSLDSLRSLISVWQPAELFERKSNVSLIVFDEAHRSVASTYKATIKMLHGNNTAMLGLSATPGRRHFGEDASEDQQLVDLFSSQFVQLKMEGYRSPVDYLVEKGFLARLHKEHLRIANTGLTRIQLKEMNDQIAASMDVPGDILKTLGMNATRNLQILERVERLVKEEGHKRVIVFAPSVESAVVLANICLCLNIEASSVHAQSPDRQSVIAKFKNDTSDPQVIFNYGVLTTGFDAPRTSAVVIARPTTSLVLLNQMAGRAIRGPLVQGNETARLITVVDTEIPVLVEPNMQFHAFDDSWRNIDE